MQRAFYNLTQSMINHQRSLDAISNNLTNINTAGYKKDDGGDGAKTVVMLVVLLLATGTLIYKLRKP